MKKIVSVLILGLLLINMSTQTFAESSSGQSDWTVTYNAAGDDLEISGGKIVTLDDKSLHKKYGDDYTKDITLNDLLLGGPDGNGIEPGDSFTVTITLKHDYAQRADWYMSNDVINSLEKISQSGASGGAYTYSLKYKKDKNSNDEQVLYSSDTVGGEGSTAAGGGLHEATNALKGFFYLDTLSQGQVAEIKLEVAIDGESQGNRYQDTLADLKMRFAVQQRDRGIVRTGDDTNLTPLYVVAMLSGIGVLVLAIRDLRVRKQGRHSGKRERRSAT